MRFFPAPGAEVVSDNVVGYTKVQFSRGLSLIGQQFVAVGGEDASLQTVSGENMDADGNDIVMVWNGSEYDVYNYYPGDTCDINGDGTDAWGDENWVAVECTLPAGTGMWIDSRNESNLNFSGEVTSNTKVDFHPGLNLICAPQPLSVDLQEVTGINMDADGNDIVMIWNGTEYDVYNYYPGDTCDINGDGTDAWGDENWVPVEVTIPVGSGFWLDARGTGYLEFPNALAGPKN